MIGKIVPDGPAEHAGLNQADVISKIDGAVIETPKDVQSAVMKHKPGQTLNMLILRNKSVVAVPVKLGTYPNQDQETRE